MIYHGINIVTITGEKGKQRKFFASNVHKDTKFCIWFKERSRQVAGKLAVLNGVTLSHVRKEDIGFRVVLNCEHEPIVEPYKFPEIK